MHVTLVTPAFTHPERSDLPGIRRYSTELVKALNRKGIELRVITPEAGDPDDDLDGVEVVRLGAPLRAFGRAANVAQARVLSFGRSITRDPRLLRGTDIVHADVPLLGIDMVKHHCPVVATAHHFERIRTVGDLLSVPFGNSYGTYTYRRANAVVVPSEASASQLRRRFNVRRRRIHIIHHGIDTSRFFPDNSGEDVGTNPRTRTILFVGPMSRRKNVILLLQAFQRLTRSHPEARLVLVGSGPLDTTIDRAINSELLRGRVVRLRHLTDSRLRELYNAADVYASASVDEGFGFCVAEAMACRTPVVVLDQPVTREIVADAGVLMPDSRPIAWGEALGRLLDDTTLADDLAERGRRRVMDLYSWDAAADKYVRLYEQLTEARRRS